MATADSEFFTEKVWFGGNFNIWPRGYSLLSNSMQPSNTKICSGETKGKDDETVLELIGFVPFQKKGHYVSLATRPRPVDDTGQQFPQDAVNLWSLVNQTRLNGILSIG